LKSHSSLVLGCQGQDGALLCKSLLQKNQKVVGSSRFKKKNLGNLEKLKINNDIEQVQLNLSDQLAIEKTISKYQPNVIYNLSAQSSVGQSFNKLEETFISISYATQNLLEVCRRMNFKGKIFFAGSSEMYGSYETRINIEDSKSPLSPYAIAKLNSFQIVKIYRNLFNIDCITGVLFNHESSLRGDTFVFPKIIKSAIISSKNRCHKTKMGNIYIQRDWGWAEEYVEAMQIVANSDLRKDYLICTGQVNSMHEIISKVFNLFNLDWQQHIIIDPKLFRKEEINKSFGNPIPIYKDLSWKANIFIDQIIKNLVENYQS